MNTESRAGRTKYVAASCIALAIFLAIGTFVRSKTDQSRPTWGISAAAAQSAPPAAAMPKPNPDREAFFGQTHLHTSWSPDAYIFGNTVTGPAEAYQYA